MIDWFQLYSANSFNLMNPIQNRKNTNKTRFFIFAAFLPFLESILRVLRIELTKSSYGRFYREVTEQAIKARKASKEVQSTFHYYRPPTKLGEGNVFNLVCLSVCPQGVLYDHYKWSFGTVRGPHHTRTTPESIGSLWRRKISTIVALFDLLTSKSPP